MILKILLNFSPDVYYKYDRFSKTLPKKSFKFVLIKKNDIFAFNLSFILLLVEINLISKKQSYKNDMFIAYNIGYIKIIFILLTKIVAFYIQVLII